MGTQNYLCGNSLNSFNVLNQLIQIINFIKDEVNHLYLRSLLGQKKLSNMTIPSMENEISKEVDFENINKFTSIKTKKVKV